MNSIIKHSSAPALFAVWAMACGTEIGKPGDGQEHRAGTPVDPQQLVEELTDSEGLPGESPSDSAKAAGRVYIEYCDRPNNSAGTICRTHDGTLQWPADRDECRRDTTTVCGGPTQTWIICAGKPCYYMD
jgi:hypothetical protein